MSDPQDIIRTAIALRVCITASYNKRIVKLAPQGIVAKHDEPYLQAVTLEQAGAPPNSKRLGTFKIAGLTGLALTGTRYGVGDLAVRPPARRGAVRARMGMRG